MLDNVMQLYELVLFVLIVRVKLPVDECLNICLKDPGLLDRYKCTEIFHFVSIFLSFAELLL